MIKKENYLNKVQDSYFFVIRAVKISELYDLFIFVVLFKVKSLIK
jgi:hypothetical protein